MKEYVCSVCGYIHKGELPDDFVCPICGAGKDAFILKEEKTEDVKSVSEKSVIALDDTHDEKELSPMEISIICSNLARGCEKQYLFDEAASFKKIAEYYRLKATHTEEKTFSAILDYINKDLEINYPYANQIADDIADRGAKRALVWSEKVTRMLQSLLKKYEIEGDKMLENVSVYVCTICGYVYIGNHVPDICPVCKVPSWKFEKIEKGGNL